MANVAVKSKIENESLTEDANGQVYRRRYLVENVAGTDAHFDALAAVPAYASAHETRPNLFVSRRETKPFQNSTTQVYVDVEWRPPDFGGLGETVITYHGTAKEVITSYDANGDLIVVKYTPTGGSAMPNQVGQVRGTEVEGALRFEFFTASDPTPFTAVRGTLNSGPWRGRPALTWKCSDVIIEKIWSRSGFRVALEFLEAERDCGWMSVAVYRLLGGIIPADIKTPIDLSTEQQANGWTTALASKTANFSSLPLPPVGF